MSLDGERPGPGRCSNMSASRMASLRRRAWVIPVLSAVLALSACGGGSLGGSGGSGGGGGAASGPVKIGLSVPKSGVYASLGRDMEQGFKLYLNQKGNKLGGKDITLVETDEGSGPQTGVPATEKLITQDQVSAVAGIVNSATAAGLKKTFVESKVPLVVANAGADGLTTPPSDYIWRTSFKNSDPGRAYGKKVKEELGDGSVYLLGADYASGKEHLAGFKESFTAAGGQIVGEDYTPFGTTTDWQPYLNKVRTSGAKAVFVFYAGAEAVNFVKQYKQFLAGDGIQLLSFGDLTEGTALEAEGAAADGLKTVLHYSDQLDNPANQAFVKAYADAYGGATPTAFSVQAYDAAAVLDKALAAADGTSGEAIGKALGTVSQVDSPRGTWKFTANHDPDQTFYERQVVTRNGKFVNTVLGTVSAS
ncbi:amino acid ABC transporter substrate-binding protein [Enemella evansiae]|uniref:Amino acid ABC transporter substrate-binding protein n=2 Tax=Enemella evansiae TaxID=2016499 RepID=A0A255GBU0_9ACTN|nr:amino acid ABC transporter substrate-binding protein [Enemella evansiae]OYO13368.1 amino acid ABC transporter substrate-binding protein [Enemella evansiae]